uniref:Uncharacterized protein n=1 Tax=Hyaloperonospora arabidopsidis (strain Emoy2) TaxID=559515 RepID=M4B779_HYAAE
MGIPCAHPTKDIIAAGGESQKHTFINNVGLNKWFRRSWKRRGLSRGPSSKSWMVSRKGRRIWVHIY